jgi:hypothetical protein
MLLSPDTFELIHEIPHPREYRVWKSRLTQSEYDDIIKVLIERISGDQICTSSWIPGSDWTDTPFQIIYSKACEEDEQSAAFFFGLMLWDAVIQHQDTWSFGKYHQCGIRGMTYFRVQLDETKRRELLFKY